MTMMENHSKDLEKEMEKEMEEIQKEYVKQQEKNARDLREWRELIEESDIATEELREAIADLNKALERKGANIQDTLAMTPDRASPAKQTDASVPSLINMNQLTSGPYQGLIEPAGPSGTSEASELTSRVSSKMINMEMEGPLNFQTLRKRMGHEIHPISMMMARCPPLNPETGLPYDVSQSPSSPSIVSVRSSATPKPLADEYLSSSSISTPSYQPVQIQTSATQTDAPPPVHSQGTQTENQPPRPSQESQIEVFILEIKMNLNSSRIHHN